MTPEELEREAAQAVHIPMHGLGARLRLASEIMRRAAATIRELSRQADETLITCACGEEVKRCDSYLDGHGCEVCEDCHADDRFVCCLCGEFDNTAEQHLLLVVTAESASAIGGPLGPGTYLIAKWPYYADGMIEGHFYADSLLRIGDVPEGADTGCYEAGHLCSACQRKFLAATIRELEKQRLPDGTNEVGWIKGDKALGVHEHAEGRWFWCVCLEMDVLAQGYAESPVEAIAAAEAAGEADHADV